MSSAVQREYLKLSEKYQHITLREQLLVLLCGLVAVVLFTYTLLIGPVIESANKLDKSANIISKEITGLSEQVSQLSVKLEADPDAPINARVQALQEQIQKINQQLAEQTKNLVPANKMAGVLESVLADSKGLRLVELQSIAPVAILMDDKENQQTGLYRHGVALEFEGSYFDIQGYLTKLESLPWQFYWKKFDYLVAEYPTATVKLEIYTLSTNKAFIGI